MQLFQILSSGSPNISFSLASGVLEVLKTTAALAFKSPIGSPRRRYRPAQNRRLLSALARGRSSPLGWLAARPTNLDERSRCRGRLQYLFGVLLTARRRFRR